MIPKFSANRDDPWWELPEERRNVIMDWMESVGTGSRRDIRAMAIGEGYITIERYLRNDQGDRYLAAPDVVATTMVTVPISEPPPPAWP